jgi:replication-associated recombination protein RarA
MEQQKQKLFWERYRPNSINKEKGKIPIILLPRIKNIVDKELEMNLLFYGCGGTGKSSLVEIILEDFDTLKINCSMPDQRGIDVVGEEISEHCENFSIPFKKKKLKDHNGQKAVWLEEFDNSTADMRKALRGYIEEHPEIRFVATVNNLAKINRTEEDKALISRFNVINFDPNSKDEIDFLKTYQKIYLKSICKNINFELSDDIICAIIDRTFPNFRSSVQLLQEVSISGDFDSYLKEKEHINADIFSYIMKNENNINKNFFYVQDNFPREKTEDLLKMLSRPFFKYLIENYEDIVLKSGFKIIELSKIYNAEYLNTLDPEMHLTSYINNLKRLILE